MDNTYIYNLRNGRQIVTEVPQALEHEVFQYNCGGFALGTFDWYLPYDLKTGKRIAQARRDYDKFENYESFCDRLADLYVDYMQEEIPALREIELQSELRDDEYLVAFRAAEDDFHYARRLDDGTWAQKMGGTYITEWSEEKVFDSEWNSSWNRYAGRVRLLAVKKNWAGEYRQKRGPNSEYDTEYDSEYDDTEYDSEYDDSCEDYDDDDNYEGFEEFEDDDDIENNARPANEVGDTYWKPLKERITPIDSTSIYLTSKPMKFYFNAPAAKYLDIKVVTPSKISHD